MAYYTAQPHFEAMLRKQKPTHAFCAKTGAEFDAWSKGLRAALCKATGLDTMTPCPPAPELLEETACEGYTRRKLTIATEPDVHMTFYILVPDACKTDGPRSAVIACHGHGSNGKEPVAGVRTNDVIAGQIDHYNYDYGEVLAQTQHNPFAPAPRRSCVVFAPDARGFGERRERYEQGDTREAMLSSSCAYLNAMAIPLGQSVTGMWVFDLMRLADFALACPEVNGHIGCVGLSGGGLQSLWLAALDERMESCVVSGYFYGYLESLLVNHNCACNYVPGLWQLADIGDIGALVAPRPLLIETGDKDDLNGRSGLQNVTSQVNTVREAMALLGKPDHVYHDIFDGEHRWNGVYAYDWMLRHMPPKAEEGK